MARQVCVSYVDDLDGKRADETVTFSLDGSSYEIDLSSGNATRLRDALAEFVAAARRRRAPGPGDRTVPAPAATSVRARNQDIRRWARAQGRLISDRGRLPADLIAAYGLRGATEQVA